MGFENYGRSSPLGPAVTLLMSWWENCHHVPRLGAAQVVGNKYIAG